MPARNLVAGIGQAIHIDGFAGEFIGAYNSNKRMLLGYLHHAADAIRENPVIRLDHLAIFAIRRNAGDGKVVILYLRQKRVRAHQSDLFGITGRVLLRNLARSVGAAVIHQNVFPIPVVLPQHTFDTLWQEFACVVERGNDTDQRLRGRVLPPTASLLAGFRTDHHDYENSPRLNAAMIPSAVRVASAEIVNAGFTAAPVTNTLPSPMNKLGTSWVRHSRSTTDVFESLPIRDRKSVV